MKSCYVPLAFSLVLFSAHASGLPGESIMLDPNTGDYTIAYFGINEETGKRDALRTTTFEPATKIEPNIRSNLQMDRNGLVSYSFRVRNGAASRQPIVKLLLDPVSSLVTTDLLSQKGYNVQSNATIQNWGVASYPMVVPQGWTGRSLASRVGGLRVSWSSIRYSLPAGGELERIRFYSQDLAGIGLAQFQGDSAITIWPDEGPIGEIGEQLKQIKNSDYISRLAAVPTIAVPVPFDAAVLLDRIRTHAATWPDKQLLDSVFAAQVDRYLAAAADAYRLNNTKAGKEHIMTVRKMLAKEHHHVDHDDEDDDDTEERKTAPRFSIDRLAARVLDFDLRYVLKRTEREHEQHEGKKGRD